MRPQLIPLVLVFALVGLSTAAPAPARAVATASSCVKNTTYSNRLPAAVIQPRHYQLNVSLPDPSADHPTDSSYDGSITLTMDVYSPTTCIILHAENIVISTSSVTLESGATSLTSSSIEYTSDGNSFLIIHFNSTLPLGSASIILPFIAHYAQQPGQGLFLSDNRYETTDYPPIQIKQLAKQFQQQHNQNLQSRGKHVDRHMEVDQGDVASSLARDAVESDRYLFPSTTVLMPDTDTDTDTAAAARAAGGVRVDPPKSILRMFATQFESTFARRAFPCMDEPALKAVWRSRITVPFGVNLTVLFNSDLASRSSPYMLKGVLVEDWNFLPMKHVQSSYLVAIAVGHFDYVETYSQGVRFRVYTPPNRSEYGRFALNVSAEIVAWFGKKWNFSYADMNSKMDQISVPGLYQNAMENWGLLTYYPPFLLADTVSPSRIALELVAQVSVHEIAHQWFGDTITMPYWSSEYLQEGYARFLQYVGVDALFPEWNVFNEHAQSTAFGDISFFGWPYSTALRVDFAGLAPPIVVPENQKALSNMFYEKGASVNRMWYDYFGASTWHSIFAYHINTHRYSNPSVTDLIASFNHVVPTRDWSQPILSWLTQPNLPVIRLHWDPVSSRIIASQSPLSRFTNHGIHARWWIPAVPVSISSTLLPDTYTFALEFESTSTVQILAPPFPSHAQARDIEMIGNMNFTHYMLISYGPEQWPAVIKAYTQPEPDRVGYELRSQFINTVILLTQMSHETVDVLIELTDSISGLLIRCLYTGRTSDVLDWSRTLLNGWLRINTALSSNELTKQVFPVSHIYQRIYASIGSASSSVLSIITWNSQVGESAQMTALRDLWTFWSVYYGLKSSLATAVNYYTTAPDPLRVPADIKSAVLWAVVAQSDQEPYTSYYANLLSLVTSNSTSFDDRALLYRTLVGAVPTLGQCLQVSQLITTAISEPITQLPLFSYGMKYSHSLACIRQYRYEYQQVANQLWNIQGAAATNTILNGLSGVLSAGSDRVLISSWLSSSGFVSSEQLYATLTQIDINKDIVTVNTPFQPQQQQQQQQQ